MKEKRKTKSSHNININLLRYLQSNTNEAMAFQVEQENKISALSQTFHDLFDKTSKSISEKHHQMARKITLEECHTFALLERVNDVAHRLAIINKPVTGRSICHHFNFLRDDPDLATTIAQAYCNTRGMLYRGRRAGAKRPASKKGGRL